MNANRISFGETAAFFSGKVEDNLFQLLELRLFSNNWLHDAPCLSGLFGITVNRDHFTCQDLTYVGFEPSWPAEGVEEWRLHFEGPGWEIVQRIRYYRGQRVFEFQPLVLNQSASPLWVQRVDSLDLTLKAEGKSIAGYSGNWGSEFEPLLFRPYQYFVLESRWGRSSKGHHPWTAILAAEGAALVIAPVWSGNWVLRFEPQQAGGFHLSGGLHDWQFAKELRPGETFSGIPVVIALGEDLNKISQQLAWVGRHFWYPSNQLAQRLPIEWNPWWPYEDVAINEAVFLANAEKAAELGFEVCTLDAGWFGPPGTDNFWYDYRGDWDLVNPERFPHGIRFLADRVHALGMKFGIWCEIEALGEKAKLAQAQPDWVAMRDGKSLGYICLGNPTAQAWAYQTLARLICDYHVDWIKLDFNLDPGAGCNRTDHGHQAGDGLYAHYLGYYAILARLRHDYPEIVLENCSSGGLRIDLGILRHTHATFLSDPDWPVHDLQVFWGASTLLAPNTLLHWTYSHWRNTDPPPAQRFNPWDPSLTRTKWDYYTRISMLGWYGLSQKLTELPSWMAQRIAEHNHMYQQEIRPFIREAHLYRLTEQPLRQGIGERWAAFQYSLPEAGEHLLFIFRLPGGEPKRAIRLCNLDSQRSYWVHDLEGELEWHLSGKELLENGLVIDFLEEEASLLLKIQG